MITILIYCFKFRKITLGFMSIFQFLIQALHVICCVISGYTRAKKYFCIHLINLEFLFNVGSS